MDAYRLVLFCHVLAVVGLFAALAIEWVSLRHVRASTSYEAAREWSGLFGLLVPLGVPSTLVVLASGIYLATTLGVWELGWIRLAVPTLVVVAIAGAVAGPRRNRSRAAIANGDGALPRDLVAQLRHPLLGASWRVRFALLLGLLSGGPGPSFDPEPTLTRASSSFMANPDRQLSRRSGTVPVDP
jgi:hypothetical protein